MNRVILQVPMTADLKKQAEKAASEHGFSSLQESVRVFLKQLSEKRILLSIHTIEPAEHVALSTKAKNRYSKVTSDIQSGRNVTKTETLNEAFKLLKQ